MTDLKPVAWMYEHSPDEETGVYLSGVLKEKPEAGGHWKIRNIQPLYTHPTPEAAVSEAVAAIQAVIDRYSIAGGNLLEWLDHEDRETMPKPKGRPAGVPWNMPTSIDWERWASEVSCRKFFKALHEAKEAALAAQGQV